MRIRTLIIDDEFLARRKLMTLLEPFSQIQIVGEAKNGKEAVEMIELKSPDLIFLDVEMPAYSGMEVIKRLSPSAKIPLIVFSTAFDQYAVKAFEIQAIDYLLKPFTAERVALAVERVESKMKDEEAKQLNDNIFRLLSGNRQSAMAYRQFFEVKKNGRKHLIPNENVVYIRAEGNYVELIQLKGKDLYRITMNSLESELDPHQFIRIHRSIFVNVHYIASCKYLSNAEYKIRLKNNEELISGRSYKDRIIAYLG